VSAFCSWYLFSLVRTSFLVRIPNALAVSVLGPALVLAGCGSDDSGGDVAVSGEFGDKPELTVPGGEPAAELVVTVLSEGDGPEVAAGDLLVVNYLGQTWEPRAAAETTEEAPPDESADDTATEGEGAEGEDADEQPADGEPVPFVFDSSYDRGEPASFEIGVGMVIGGWDEGLVGQNVGSRVLLSIPPDLGYGGMEGHDLAGDTLLFVVDILGTYNASLPISGEPVDELAADLPTVSGEGAEEPTVEFPASAEPVGESTTDLLVAGDGAELGRSLVVKALEASYDGETGYSSWSSDRVEVITSEMVPGLAEALEGQRVGSRVLSRIAPADNPTEDNPDGEPIVIVLDIVGTF
jgi:FKBP-type peptidyl-prolyl cis-trans isomerase